MGVQGLVGGEIMKRLRHGVVVKETAVTFHIASNGEKVIRSVPSSYIYVYGGGVTYELDNFEWPEVKDVTPRLKETEGGWELVVDGNTIAEIDKKGGGIHFNLVGFPK